MTETIAMDVSGLKPYRISNQSLLWWGQVLLCAIEGTMFLILIAMYFYYRLSVDVWPLPGTAHPGLWKPTIALVPLFASAYGSYVASEGAKQNSRERMILGLMLNLALAGIFLVLRGLEMSTFTFDWKTDIHGSIVWGILFLHTLDVVADLLLTLVLAIIVAIGSVGEKQRIGVHVDSVIWYFLVAIWIPMYIVVYWGPVLVGNR